MQLLLRNTSLHNAYLELPTLRCMGEELPGGGRDHQLLLLVRGL